MDRSSQIRAMASESRMSILRMLAHPEACIPQGLVMDPEGGGVCMNVIADALAVAQPTASRHLDILKQAGFIRVTRRHRWSYCRRDDAAISDYLDWLRQHLAATAE